MIIRMALSIFILIIGSSLPSHAETKSFTATLLIRAPVSVTEITPLSLGVVTQPITTPAQFNLSPEGTATTDLDDGLIGGHQSGKFRFSGESNSTLLISSSVNSCDNTDITFNNVHISQNEIILSEEGMGELDVGLNLSVAAGITPASYNCSYTIEFLYQ